MSGASLIVVTMLATYLLVCHLLPYLIIGPSYYTDRDAARKARRRNRELSYRYRSQAGLGKITASASDDPVSTSVTRVGSTDYDVIRWTPAVSTSPDPDRPNYFAADGSRVRVNGELITVNDPALRRLVADLAKIRAAEIDRRSRRSNDVDLADVWDRLGFPDLAARERVLRKMATEHDYLSESTGTEGS